MDPYYWIILDKYKKEIEKMKTLFDEVKPPQGPPGALILPKTCRISSWTYHCCNKSGNK